MTDAQTPRKVAAELLPSVLKGDAETLRQNLPHRFLDIVADLEQAADELAALRGQLAEYEFAAESDEFDERGVSIIDLGHHYTDALMALTERKAYSKSSCAQMIAEQSERAEHAESALADAKAEIAEARKLAEFYKAEMTTPDCIAAYAAAKAEAIFLKEALEKYGEHDVDCALLGTHEPCSCGLDNILDAISKE